MWLKQRGLVMWDFEVATPRIIQHSLFDIIYFPAMDCAAETAQARYILYW